jgi:regulator of telomere elongation helicase 1
LLDDLNLALGGARTGALQEPKLAFLAQCLGKVYKGRDLNECMQQAVDYSVFVREEPAKLGKGKRTVNYWCFSPGVAMEELKRLGVRSILLTSGTLSPMEAFREDLKIPFRVVLENPHVIGPDQVWISVIGTGPNGKGLNSSFERRETAEYKDELGLSILNICRSMRNLPSQAQNKSTSGLSLLGGVLVFFPTYGTMDSAVTRWRASGLWEDLCQSAGHVVIESKGSEQSSRSKAGNNSSESDRTSFVSAKGSSAQQMGTIEEFESALQRRGTCMLLAVCRGKVSEGIDFRDSKGRIVIITGPWQTICVSLSL